MIDGEGEWPGIMIQGIASDIAAQIIAFMISGEMPIDPKVVRGCCKKLGASSPLEQPTPALIRLVEAVEVLDTAILFKLPEKDLLRMRRKAREALFACAETAAGSKQN